MTILGVGTVEFLLILVIMLIVAGPKRMVWWANLLGQYVAKFRRMWAQMARELQKEFDEAGVDIQVPKTPPSRAHLDRMAQSALKTLSQPLEQAAAELRQEGDFVRQRTAPPVLEGKGSPEARPDPPEGEDKSDEVASDDDFGTWST